MEPVGQLCIICRIFRAGFQGQCTGPQSTMIASDVMTVREVADYLKVKDRTIYRLVAGGEMPGFKVGGSWRFRKTEIDRWTEANAVGPGEGDKKVVSGR